MDGALILFGGIGIVFVILAIFATVKEAKEGDSCIVFLAWPVVIALGAILYFGFFR
ncbi:hypothetical protein [Streptomyces sp. 900105245]